MEHAALAAVVCLTVVSIMAMGATIYAVRTLARSSRERREDFIRALVAERKAELAGSAAELAAATWAETVHPIQQEEETPAPEHRGVEARRKRRMVESFMDPNDPEEVELFDSMVDMGFDPSDPEDREYWNRVTETPN